MARKDEPWSCKVGIMREVDADRALLAIAEYTPFGPPIHNAREVCKRIQRAQVAILYPEIDPQDLVEGGRIATEPRGCFSLNSIIVNINGPTWRICRLWIFQVYPIACSMHDKG